MPWPGGKSGAGVYHRLCAEVPPHDERISPFLGHCGVMRNLRPAAVNVGIDLDPAALELWRGFAWRDEGRLPSPHRTAARSPRLTLVQADGIAWLRHRFGLLEWPRPTVADMTPVEVFRRLYLSADAASHCVARATRPGAAAPGRGVPFVFCDPPYPRATLKDRHRYVSDLTDEQHVELLTVLRSIPALVMIVSYPNDLYAEHLADWRTFRYRAFTRRGERTEQAWCNFPPPVVLHDWRFVGRDRRQRETIARRVRSWRRMYAELAPPIRAALLEGLQAEAAELDRSQSQFAGVCHRCGTVRAPDVTACPVCRVPKF